MEINIDDYITEEEKASIARDEFRAQCRKASAEDFERIITNSAYEVVWSAVEEEFDGDCQAALKEKIHGIIDNLSEFSVFKSPDAWSSKTNTPYEFLVSCVRENRDLLSEKVQEVMQQMPNKDMRLIVLEVMKGMIK